MLPTTATNDSRAAPAEAVLEIEDLSVEFLTEHLAAERS